jgi:Flp pilus assembly protein TadD
VRTFILAVLLVGYGAVFLRLPSLGATRAFDPLEPRGRQVESDLAQGRFEDALPIALALEAAYPSESVIPRWLADIYHGLGRDADEARALERVLALTADAEAACPDLPIAYGQAAQPQDALAAYERCANLAPDNAERWLDLGAAYTSAGRDASAERAYETSRAIDPSNPRLPHATTHATDMLVPRR